MRRVIVSLIAVLFAASRSAAPVRPLPPRQLEAAPKEVILGWINHLPAQSRSRPRAGRGARHEPARPAHRLRKAPASMSGFLAGVIASNPDKADALIAKMFPLSPEHHWAIVRAIAYSGRPDWRTLLQRDAERMPARRVMIERFLAGKLPTLDAGADREGRDLGREDARAVHAREVLLQARDRDEARAHARPARHAVGLLLRDRQLPAALAHRPDAALDEGARRDGEAHPRQHGEVHARHQLGAQRRPAREPEMGGDAAAAGRRQAGARPR